MPRKATGRPILRTASLKLGSYLLRLDHPRVMGIVNCTEDSFSGDGLGGDSRRAVDLGELMLSRGADLVDIGGESTRPGARPVPEKEEIRRVVPVIKELSALHPGRISVDTRKAGVAKAALEAGAALVNDVSGLRDGLMVQVVAEHEAAAVIMHMQGTPETMQARPRYKDVVADIIEFLQDRISDAERGGVNPRKIVVDPGIGFGKTLEHNLEILGRLGEFRSLGKPIMVGASRKSFIGRLTGEEDRQRLEGSLAAAVLAAREGADIIRVHDVAETVRALKVSSAISERAALSRNDRRRKQH